MCSKVRPHHLACWSLLVSTGWGKDCLEEADLIAAPTGSTYSYGCSVFTTEGWPPMDVSTSTFCQQWTNWRYWLSDPCGLQRYHTCDEADFGGFPSVPHTPGPLCSKCNPHASVVPDLQNGFTALPRVVGVLQRYVCSCLETTQMLGGEEEEREGMYHC